MLRDYVREYEPEWANLLWLGLADIGEVANHGGFDIEDLIPENIFYYFEIAAGCEVEL